MRAGQQEEKQLQGGAAWQSARHRRRRRRYLAPQLPHFRHQCLHHARILQEKSNYRNYMPDLQPPAGYTFKARQGTVAAQGCAGGERMSAAEQDRGALQK